MFRGRWRDVALVATSVALVAATCAWRLADSETSQFRVWADRHTKVTLEARVASDPRTFRHFGRQSAAVGLDAQRTTVGASTTSGHDPVLAFVSGDVSDLWVGQRVTMRGRLSPSDDPRTVARLTVEHRGPAHAAAWWWSAAQRVREGIRDSVRAAEPGPRALVPALVDGDDADLSEHTAEEFRRSGLTHLTAVSGANLTIVLATVMAMVSVAGLRRRFRLVLGVFCVASFVLVARPDPSVVRAAAMGSVALVAVSAGGRGGLRALSVGVVALMVLDPWLARAAGFALSVVATAGILVAAPPLAARLARWMPHACAIVLAVPLSAQLACTPAIALLSGEVSLVAVFANVLAEPLVAPATVMGLAGGIVDLANRRAGSVVGSVAAFFAQGILGVAHHAALLSGASVPWRSSGALLLVVVLLVGIGVWRFAHHPAVIIGLAVGLVLVLLRPPQAGWPPRGWLMVACDVGQGDATVLHAGAGTGVLVDAGPEPLAVDLCLRRLHVRRLAVVVLTHAHADHIGGLPGALRGRPVGPVLHGPSGGPGRVMAAGDRLVVGALQITALWPPAASPVPDRGDGTAMNNSSVVLAVRTHGTRLLLVGDVETEGQARIRASGLSLASDVLKFSHHGSSRQDPAFLDAVHARIATISVGADNDYGHPSPHALALLRAAGTAWRRTDLDGDIAVVKHDGRLLVVTHH